MNTHTTHQSLAHRLANHHGTLHEPIMNVPPRKHPHPDSDEMSYPNPAAILVGAYVSFIYRGSVITNAVEGLTARDISRPVATGAALVASTLAFALVHLPGAVLTDANVGLVVVKTGLLGGLFGLAYLRTNELALPMGLHLGVNYALVNIFGIGAPETPGVPSLLAVEHTAAGLWNASRGIPLFVATIAGYVIVLLWTRRRNHDRTAQQRNHLIHSRSD
ncbi:type II CAAX prenyl endopeptidase Rce1 family protein [Halomicroarcula sp. GCM10025817]|uniref:CPBP family glutamic-type intramembrane protease n=1 Tax=Haloarcula TaxID=2237 RepID=UPI0023E89A81|nr:CPBP family glutamic-type intramembrane protease [Halomicroarcula sp. SYNS111]